MIELLNISKCFGEKQVLDKLSLTVNTGEHLAIMGESGKGKTTLLRIIAFLEKADEGSICGLAPGDIAYAFQEPRLFPTLSALKNLIAVSHESFSVAEKKARALLERIGLSDASHKKPAELSGGMKQRLSLARVFMVDCPSVLLDEPFSALDEDTKDDMIQFVKEMTKDKTLIMVTHNREDAEKLCTRIVELGSIDQ